MCSGARAMFVVLLFDGCGGVGASLGKKVHVKMN
jgi:hypothetical protein